MSISTKSYRLKTDRWSDYDPYFPLWTPKDRQAAEERYHLHLRRNTLAEARPTAVKLYSPLIDRASLLLS